MKSTVFTVVTFWIRQKQHSFALQVVHACLTKCRMRTVMAVFPKEGSQVQLSYLALAYPGWTFWNSKSSICGWTAWQHSFFCKHPAD